MLRSRFFKFTLFCGLFLVVLPHCAFAQGIFDPTPVTPQEPVSASAGTLVAATMETAGYKIQEIVLRDFSSILEGLGIIIIVCCAFSAIITVALSGKYEVALWFLMAPALFLFVLNSRVKSAGTEWQFGAFKDKTESVSKTLGANSPAISEVSWVFHRYNEILSSMIQGMIGIITNDQLREQTIFMSRAKIMDDLFSSEIQDPGLMELTQYSLAECSSEMNSARLEALGKRDPGFLNTPEYKTAVTKFKSQYTKKNKPIASATLRRYLRVLLKTNLDAGLDKVNSSSNKLDISIYRKCLEKTKTALADGNRVRKGDINQLLEQGVSCEQLWCWMGLGVQTEALATANDSTKRNLPENADPKIAEEVWRDITSKLTTPQQLTSKEIEKINPDLSLIPVIMGGNLLRKSMTGDVRSQMLTRFAQHANVRLPNKNFSMELDPEEAMSLNMKMQQHQYATAQKYELFTMAMMLPYLQGTMLYVLALTFPFFALMILIPGKAGSFFMWMAGWAWLKLWDLGWAFIMVIDDVLWNLMPHSSLYDPNHDPNHGPVSIMESAFGGDPAYSLTGYYTIIGVLLTSVPLLTGQIVLGAKAAMGGVLINGLKGLGQSLGGAASDWVAVDQVYKIDALKEMMNYDHAMKGANTYSSSAMEDLHNRIKHDAALGVKYRELGEQMAATGGGMVAAGAALAWTGVGVAPGAGLAIFGGKTMLSAQDLFAGGLKMEQAANERMVELRSQNLSLQHFDFANTKAFSILETMRGQTSTRMEHWNVPEVPYGVNAANQKSFDNQDANNAAIETRAGVSTIKGLLPIK